MRETTWIRGRVELAIVVAASIALLACTSIQPVPSDAGVPRVAVGDFVRVMFKDGHRTQLKVREVRADGFVGDTSQGLGRRAPAVEVRYADVTSIDSHEFSKRRTLVMVFVMLGVALLVGMMLAQGGPGTI